MFKPWMALIIFCVINGTFVSAQSKQIKEIMFPYKEGYVFVMSDTTVTYDSYSFPKEYTYRDSKYVVKAHPSKKGIWIFQYTITDKATNKVIYDSPSYLTWGKKGMTWWVESTTESDGKKTQAIKLPMKKGSSWKSTFSGKTATMTCISTDTLLTTMYGAISCFGVSYEIVFQEDKTSKVGMIMTEFYNIYAGKVYNEDVTYIENKSNGNRKIVQKGWSSITYSNLNDGEKSLIK